MKFLSAKPALLLLAGGALALSGCQSRPAGPVWDVPALIGGRIDAVKQKLGTPQAEETPDPSSGQSTWTRGGTTLSAKWRTGNKRVTEWTLVSRDEDHAVREEDHAALLLPGQLKENDPHYSLDWLEAPNRPLFYTGVRVVPALKNHAVLLRLSGAPALVQLSYSITGTGAKGDTLLVIAPYEQPFDLPDDTRVSSTATLAKTIGSNQPMMKIEIISDGRVVGQAASSGTPIRCEAEI